MPDGGRPRGSALVLLGVGPPRRVRSPNAWKPDQYSNPDEPAAPTTRRPGPSCGSRPTVGSRTSSPGVGTGGTISGTGRYLKEVSDGRVRIIGADPVGSVYSGGTGRPYLVEGVGEDFWPTTYDRDVVRRDRRRQSDGDSFRDDASPGARGGAARGRLLRDGRAGRGARRRVAGAGAPSTSWSCCCPTAAAATSRRSSTTSGWPTTASCTRPGERTVGEVLRSKDRRHCRSSCTPTRPRRCATRSTSSASTPYRSCRSSGPSRR